MTTMRCLIVLFIGIALTTVPAHAAPASAAVVVTPHYADLRSEKPHTTPSGTADSLDREQQLAALTFLDNGSGSYSPGEVAAAGGAEASTSGSTATGPSPLAFDFTSSIDQILDYFANVTALPEPTPSKHEATESSGSSSTSSSGGSPDDIAVPDKPEESVFDHDASAADTHIVPSSPATTTPPKKQSPIQSAAVISKICDAAFLALASVVVILQ